ncbi:MAG: HEAT repeat domain-containing protein [Vicinamibacterales bacterium]
MTEARTTLDEAMAVRLAEFARACKAALRAVSLYPGGHPAIGSTLGRITELTATLTAAGPFALEVRPQTIWINDAAPAKAESAIVELSDVLRRQLVGRLTLNQGADAESWRTLLMLLSRPPDEVRADGGIASLWATAGGPSMEILEIDYAEVLREKGDLAATDRLITAAMSGAQLELDESGMRLLLDLVGDPARLTMLMQQLETRTEGAPAAVRVDAFLNILRGLAEYVSRTNPGQLDHTLRQVGTVAGRLSADAMLELLLRRTRPEAMAGSVDVVSAMVHRMSDSAVAQFVSNSVITERGPSDRLAQAFHALVPDADRQRQLLSIAQPEVAASELGQEAAFQDMWQKVEAMLTSYTDEKFVSDAYARELSGARARAIDVEAASDDPPERVAEWLATVSDTSLRTLDGMLLADLLRIEEDAARWRDVAETVITHAEDLVRVGYFDQAFHLAESVATEGTRLSARSDAARGVLDRLGRGAMMRHAAKRLRTADDDIYGRLKRLAHSIGPAVVAPLAEALTAEQDARSRRRLRDILVEFGAAGRESVQQLMNAQNWEVRRTAAFLLREFGGAEGLKELQPLLQDTEPLVQREAIQALVMNGTDAASAILLDALNTTAGRPRTTLIGELTGLKDERAAPLFCYLIRHLDRKRFASVYMGAIDALGTFGGPDAVEALKSALQAGDWRAPLRTRRIRASAAQALRLIGTPAAVMALRDSSTRGSLGVRRAAGTELKRLG